MTELHRRALEALERSNSAPYPECADAFADFIAQIGELGRGGELDGLGPVTVSEHLLGDWLGDRREELQLGLEEGYLGRAARYRSDVAFLGQVAEISRANVLSADGFTEKILAAWSQDSVSWRPDGIPDTHWWYFPPHQRLGEEVASSVGAVDISPGEPCEAIRSVAGALHAGSLSALESMIDEPFFDIAPDERPAVGDPGEITIRRLREAVARGTCEVRSQGSRSLYVFADRRLEATVEVDGGRAALGGFEPRAKVVLDPGIGPLGDSLELLRRAAATERFLERRLLVFEFFDRLGSIGRYRPRDELLAARDQLVALFSEIPFEVIGSWNQRCLLRQRPSPSYPKCFEGQQIREDRSAAAFLYDLLGDHRDLRPHLDANIGVEYWDDDIRRALGRARRCQVPEGTPESHWWWYEGRD